MDPNTREEGLREGQGMLDSVTQWGRIYDAGLPPACDGWCGSDG